MGRRASRRLVGYPVLHLARDCHRVSIHVAGVIYTFASLVLPALIAKNLSQEVRSMFFISPLVASTTGIFSCMLANYYDYPPDQMATAVLCFVLVVAWFVHYVRATRLSN